MDIDFVIRFISIALIDLALSGDNAIVIGMAAASLPRRERRFAIISGGVLAIVLRVLLTSFATRLMLVPLISAIGGGVLFGVAWGLLKVDTAAHERTVRTAHGLRNAIQLIVIADFTMSLDNVLAIGGTARGDDILVLAGLLLSMPLLMITGGFVSTLIDRFGWIVYLGAGAICLMAAQMILEDGVVAERLQLGQGTILGVSFAIAVALPVVFRMLHVRRARTTETPAVPEKQSE